MKKMTIRKLLENIVAKSYGQKIKKFYLVSTDGEVVTADFAIDLVRNVASCNFLWEVEVVSAKRVDDYDNTCNHSNGKQVKSKSPVNENENGNENEERGTGTRPTGAAATPRGFDRFWAAYPRRVGKQDALKAWGQLNPDDALVDQIVAGVERWKTCDQWTKDGGSFICYPATFIRGRRWEEDDQPDPPPATPKGAAPKNYADDEDFLEGR